MQQGHSNTYESIPSTDADNTHHNEAVEHKDEDPKVSTLELFADLVMVVSIHVVAEPLEEEEDPTEQHAVTQIYVCRVFFLWLAWHMVTLLMNAAVKMQTQNCPMYHSVMFVWMAVVLQMAQAFAAADDRQAVLWYLALRAFVTAMFARQVYFPYRQCTLRNGTCGMAVSEEWLVMMQRLACYLTMEFVLCEGLPLTLALVWGTTTAHRSLYMPAIYVAMGLIFVAFVASAVGLGNGGTNNASSSDNDDDDDGRKNKPILATAFDAEHLQERYVQCTCVCPTPSNAFWVQLSCTDLFIHGATPFYEILNYAIHLHMAVTNSLHSFLPVNCVLPLASRATPWRRPPCSSWPFAPTC